MVKMQNDKFIKRLRALFRETKTTPPPGAWDNISMKLDIEESWEEISRRLAIDEGWENISGRLDAMDTKKRYLTAAKAVLSTAASVLLVAGLYFFISQYSPTSPPAVKDPLAHRSALQVDSVSGRLTQAGEPRVSSLKIPAVTRRARPETPLEEVAGIYTTGEIEAERIADLPIRGAPSLRAVIDVPKRIKPSMAVAGQLQTLPADTTELTGYTAHTPAETGELAASALVTPGRTYLGASTSMKNTWLINASTISGLSRHELHTTLPGFGYNLGLAGSRRFTPKFSLHADISFISETGQRYNRYLEGRYVSENIRLSYSTLTVAMKYTFSQGEIWGTPVHTSLYAGPYAGMLGSAKTYIDSEKTNTTSRYSRWDWGGMAGVGHDIYISHNLSLSAGLFFRYGLTNIYAGEEEIPAELRYTNTGSLELFLSIQRAIGR